MRAKHEDEEENEEREDVPIRRAEEPRGLEFQATWFLGASYRDILAFLILFVILVFRPSGLLGGRTT